MMRIYGMAALLLVAACGHKTNLVRPRDIPEYERKRQEKIDKYAPYDKGKQQPSNNQ